MSEETQKPEEHKEEAAPQQPETTPEASAEKAEATTEETTTEATEVVAEEAAVSKPVEILTERPALAEPGDFDWDAFESDTDDYSKDDRTQLEATYEDSLNLIREKEVVDGTIISISKKEVVVNIGYKSEGVVSANEFRYNPDLKVGDLVPIFIERQEDKNGQLVVSHRTARIFSAWDKINEAKEQDIIIQAWMMMSCSLASLILSHAEKMRAVRCETTSWPFLSSCRSMKMGTRSPTFKSGL